MSIYELPLLSINSPKSNISGAGDEFYPYQNISPNTLRCYEPSEKYKAIYHPQIPLRCITVQVDQEFIDQYLQEISGDLEVNFSDFFKEKGKFYLPNVNHAMQSLYEYLLSMKASRITVEAKIYEIISYLASYLKENRLNEENSSSALHAGQSASPLVPCTPQQYRRTMRVTVSISFSLFKF